MQIEVLGNGGIDQVQEPQELVVTVPAVVLGDVRPAGQVQHGEQAGGAVADLA
ncbi:hypothetical protein [Kribbella albertanoniae]|uniref:hypothetical protein n=1 Tax=Kribbella albertanoniae TaxID=1266829 RepID=UPI00192DFFE7